MRSSSRSLCLLARTSAPAVFLTFALGGCFEDVPSATSGGVSASDGTGGSGSGGGGTTGTSGNSGTSGESSTGGATGTTAGTGAATGGGMGRMGDPCSPLEANCGMGLKCAPLLATESDEGFLPDLTQGRCVMAPAAVAQPFTACAPPMKATVEGDDVLIENCAPGSVCFHGLEKAQATMMIQGACRPLCSFGRGAAVPCPQSPLNGPSDGSVSPPPENTPALCVGLGNGQADVGLCMAWCNPLREMVQGASTCTPITPLDGCLDLQAGDGVGALLCLPWELPAASGSSCASGADCGGGNLCIDGACRGICDISNPTCPGQEQCMPVPFSGSFPNPPGPMGWLDGLGYCIAT